MSLSRYPVSVIHPQRHGRLERRLSSRLDEKNRLARGMLEEFVKDTCYVRRIYSFVVTVSSI